MIVIIIVIMKEQYKNFSFGEHLCLCALAVS